METTKTEMKSSRKRSAKARAASPRDARLPVAKNRDDAVQKEALEIVRATTAALRSGSETTGRFGPSTNFSSELNNIDFQKMIAGPLRAAVDAQVASSMATIQFIKEVGFQADANGKQELVMVDFSHTRTEAKPDGTLDTPKQIGIRVPLLAMLPIPSLRIENVTIDFNVKLNSVESASTSSALGVNASGSGGFGPVKFKVSASYQRQSSTGTEVKKEYALHVNVKAVQDEIPAGLEKILNMLAA